MNRIWLLNLVSLSFIFAGVILALNGILGWGWLMFCALLCYTYPSKNDNADDDKDDGGNEA